MDYGMDPTEIPYYVGEYRDGHTYMGDNKWIKKEDADEHEGGIVMYDGEIYCHSVPGKCETYIRLEKDVVIRILQYYASENGLNVQINGTDINQGVKNE